MREGPGRIVVWPKVETNQETALVRRNEKQDKHTPSMRSKEAQAQGRDNYRLSSAIRDLRQDWRLSAGGAARAEDAPGRSASSRR